MVAAVIEGKVDGHAFQLVMLGFTNYFMKEKWGATNGNITRFLKAIRLQVPRWYSKQRTKNARCLTGPWSLKK